MDGKRLQQYWSNEMEALLNTYKQFQILIPSDSQDASAHKGEDGRYVENLIREYLIRFLPKQLEVLTGFILRPAVKTGLNGRERKDKEDIHSTQLDLVIYDSFNYPIFQRLGDSVIVPPEGVIAIISIKKHLNDVDILKECNALKEASKLCSCKNIEGKLMRGPYLALVSMGSKINKASINNEDWIFNKIKEAYNDKPRFTDTVGYIGAFNKWSIFKRRPKNKGSAKYVYFEHSDEEQHIGFQFILTGILSVFYDRTRSSINRPGFTAFPSGRKHNKLLGTIETDDGN